MSDQLKARITTKGPKRILALDGGGIHGMITIEILVEIENQLWQQLKKGAQFRLAHFFDFVAGSGTGAIIAACVSSVLAMSEIRVFYESRGIEMFDKGFRLNVFRRRRTKYEDETLDNTLQIVFGKDTTLGSDNLQTVLMMVMRNPTTDSPWPVSNNPFAKYNQRDRKDCNLNIPLWQLVRASTVAPVFFPPEVVTFAPGTPDEYQFIFVDGGITHIQQSRLPSRSHGNSRAL
ncbi:MAG: patatin-like phospholipase family protein [Nitrospira sp.]